MRTPTVWFVVLMILAAALACGQVPPTDQVTPTRIPIEDQPTPLFPELYQSITVDGFIRYHILHIPESYDGTVAYPLVFVLHGGSGEASGMGGEGVGFDVVADREGFILVYPNGYKRGWADGRGVHAAEAEGVDDVAYFSALLDHLEAEYNIDTNRVYTTGISNGGLMSLRLLCDLSDRFTAGVMVAASMTTVLHETCSPTEPTAVMFINGTEDPAMPYQGGPIATNRGEAIPTEDAVRWWIDSNNCDSSPAEISTLDDDPDDGTSIETTVYSGCDAGMDVALLKVVGGGHYWPGGFQYLPTSMIGIPTREIRGAEKAWEFFSAYAK